MSTLADSEYILEHLGTVIGVGWAVNVGANDGVCELGWVAQHSLVAECLAPVYIRHDENGTRQVTPKEYALEIATAQRERPNTRFVVYDHEITADRAWFLFTLMWNDASTGEKRTRAGMQLYRIEGGKLAETWLTLLSLGSAWPDVARQERWTSKRLGRRPERVMPDP